MIYDLAYLNEYKARASTELGHRIYQARWRFIQQHLEQGSVMDIGCGPGAFHTSAPPGFKAFGYDVNPYSEFREKIAGKFDALTMWDVIEHLPNIYDTLAEWDFDWLFLCTPNIDEAPADVRQFKHWKPGEHLHYFNEKALSAVLECAGYQVIDSNFDEGALRNPSNPREILSIAARRRN